MGTFEDAFCDHLFPLAYSIHEDTVLVQIVTAFFCCWLDFWGLGVREYRKEKIRK